MALPKKPEVPPTKGSHPNVTAFDTVHLPMLCLILKKTNIFKVPEVPKAAVPEKKVPEAIPSKPESPPPEGNNETSRTSIFKKRNSFLCVVNTFLQNILYTLVNSSVKMSLYL